MVLGLDRKRNGRWVERRYLKSIAGLVLAAGLLYGFTYQLDWQSVWEILRAVDLRMIGLSALLMVGTYLLRSLRWQVLLGSQDRCRFSAAFAATAIGFAALFLLGRAGEFVRPLTLTIRDRVRMSSSLASILIERVFDMVLVVLLFGLALLGLQTTGGMPVSSRLSTLRITSIVLVGVSVLGIYGLIKFHRHADGAIATLARNMARWPQRLSKPLLELLHSLAIGLGVFINREALSATILLSLLQWLLVIALYWTTLAAFDLELSISQTIFIFGFAMIGSAVPTPGGASGAYHAATAGSMMLLGIERNRAAGVAIALHLVTYAPALILGCYYLIRDGSLLVRQPDQFAPMPSPLLAGELETLPISLPIAPEIAEEQAETEMI